MPLLRIITNRWLEDNYAQLDDGSVSTRSFHAYQPICKASLAQNDDDVCSLRTVPSSDKRVYLAV